jgi:Contractile injection system tube protein
MDCLFNPTQLSEKVAVNYTRQVVPGLSHQPLQYQSTGNWQVPSVEFYLDAYASAGVPTDAGIMRFRAFLRSLTVPPAATEGVVATTPPRVLFVWPNVLTIETAITDLEFQYRQFGNDGAVLVYTATCSFEQVFDVRVTSEALRGAR